MSVPVLRKIDNMMEASYQKHRKDASPPIDARQRLEEYMVILNKLAAETVRTPAIIKIPIGPSSIR